MTLFAGPGSDPALGATELDVAPLRLSAAARADVSMVPEAWLREHHAYLQVMLALQRRDDVDVVHNNSLHHLPVAMADSLRAPVLTTLHTPPTPWLEPAIEIDSRSPESAAPQSFRGRERAHRTVVVARHCRRRRAQRRRRPTLGRRAPAATTSCGSGGIVPEKAPHRAIAMARAPGARLRIAGPVGDAGYFDRHVAGELDDDVYYVGHLDTDGLVALVGSSAAMLVTPEWDEPYGLVAAESLACGTPGRRPRPWRPAGVRRPGVGVLLPRDAERRRGGRRGGGGRPARPGGLPGARRRRLLGGPHGRELPPPLPSRSPTLRGAA